MIHGNVAKVKKLKIKFKNKFYIEKR